MVFVKDFRKDFYEVIQQQRVLLLVGLDIDAICACKILQHLFQCDQVLYTIVPVMGQSDIQKAFTENSEGIQYVIMLNCGGSIDVVELLQPEDHVVLFICDSHRPVEVHNVYNQIQVRLLVNQDEIELVPDFEQVFRDEESSNDESGNESDESEPSGKRSRFDPAKLEKKRQRRLWEEDRSKVLFNYTEFSDYGTSAALLLFEMAWKMSKDTNDLLWLAIIGVTSQFIRQQVDRDKYIEDVGTLQSHVSRHNHRPEDNENSMSVNSLKLSFDRELNLPLYRHWSLYSSLCHSQHISCKFRIWTLRGKKRLQEFLADMGLPLVKCKQKFSSMDVKLKDEIKERISQHIDKYNFREQELFVPSFHAQYGFKNRVCANDVVSAASAVLESFDLDHTTSSNFLKTLDVLTRCNTVGLEKALEAAKLQLSAVVTQVTAYLDMNQIVSAGPFLYAFVIDGSADGRFFANTICLQGLARYTLAAYCANSKSKRASLLPLVLGAPYDREKGTTLVVGIPPASETSSRNFFGKAFQQAAQSTNSRINQDFFDTNVIEMKTEDKSKFFDALISLMS